MTARELKPNQELRLQIGEALKVELRRGLAEIFGTEMLANKTYILPRNSKAAIYSYQGATIEITGEPLKCHVGQKCDYMTTYLGIHGELERVRNAAEEAGDQVAFDLSKTPIVLVCKPMRAHNVGKSTLCRILLSYAARRGRTPIFVDLDPDQNHIGIPGTIGALSIESPIDIETGLSLRSAMLMHFGQTNPCSDSSGKSGDIYKALLDSMAKVVHSKLEQDKKSYYSGVIINTCSWQDESYYKLLVHACKIFQANMVLVMDDEILQDDLQKDLAQMPVSIRNVPRTVAIVSSVSGSTVESRYLRIREYFYGTLNEPYNPRTTEVKFSHLKRLIYKLGNDLSLPDSLMPLGTKPQENQIEVTQYECSASDLLHHILAISYCHIDEVSEKPDQLLKSNVMGFICITSTREQDGVEIVSLLTPQKLPAPMDYVLLYSDVQYMDSLI